MLLLSSALRVRLGLKWNALRVASAGAVGLKTQQGGSGCCSSLGTSGRGGWLMKACLTVAT